MNFAYLTHATHTTGIDFSTVLLKKARDIIKTSGISVDLREGNAEAVDFADNSFDTVVSALSTCSFLDPIKALHEMRRVCKPNGKLLLVEHGRSSWNWIGRYQDRHVHEMIEQGGCRWNQEPQELLQEAGIKIIPVERTLLDIFHTITASPAKGS